MTSSNRHALSRLFIAALPFAIGCGGNVDGAPFGSAGSSGQGSAGQGTAGVGGAGAGGTAGRGAAGGEAGSSSAGSGGISLNSCDVVGCPPQYLWTDHGDGTCSCSACPAGQVSCTGPAAAACTSMAQDVDHDGCCSCDPAFLMAGMAVWRTTTRSLEVRHTYGSTMPGAGQPVVTVCQALDSAALSASQRDQLGGLILGPADPLQCVEDAVDYYTVMLKDLDGTSATYTTNPCPDSGADLVLDGSAVAALSLDGASDCPN